MSAGLLKTGLPGLSAEGKVDLDEKVSVDIIVEDIRADIIYDTGADQIVQWYQKNFKPKKGSNCFMIREAVLAGAVTYRLKRKDVAKLGGSTKIEKIAEGSTNVTAPDNNGTFEITRTFSPRINVCVKSDEIKSAGGAGVTANSATVVPADEAIVPEIKKIGDAARRS